MSASFESLQSESKNFGRNAYIAVERKRLRDGDATTTFVVIESLPQQRRDSP